MSFSIIRSEAQFEALGDEFLKLDEAYLLNRNWGINFGMFAEKPWYYRLFVELLEDGGMRPLLPYQRVIADRMDRLHLREETQTRLHAGQVFEQMRHHRHRRGGQLHFTRSLRP